MNHRVIPTYIALGLFTLAGCASTDVIQQQDASEQQQMARPARIIVYDVAATPADIPPVAAITGFYDDWDTPQTQEEIDFGRKLGSLAAEELTARLVEMGMTAQRAGDGPAPDFGDAIIVGNFFSIDEGTRGKRVVIGFGAGSGELNVSVNGYMVTETGPQRLGLRQVETSGGKAPGVAVPIAFSNPVMLAANSALTLKGEKGAETLEAAAIRAADVVADELREVFRKNGWIS